MIRKSPLFEASDRLGEDAFNSYAPGVRLLCISDIHGHADALSAVLAAAEQRGYAQVLVAGDICFPGPNALETWRRLTQIRAVVVQGVGDRALATLDTARVVPKNPHERARLERLAATRTELGDLILTRMRRLPEMHRIDLEDGSELLVIHGSPTDPFEPFSHDMTDEEMGALLGDDPADIIVCGGSHVPFDRMVSGVRIINVGSVGEAPSGTGRSGLHADFTIIDTHKAGIDVEQLVVPLGKAA
ncbi:MAG TPA: metallophosphoesterase family protein [Polyangium sp.]|nr:metallophosphoesterase family protein [Polyangium sp.]